MKRADARGFLNMKQGAGRAALGGMMLLVALGGWSTALAAASFLPMKSMSSTPILAIEVNMRVAQIMPIRVTPYSWAVKKAPDGSIVISGYVPDAEIQTLLLDAAGARAIDATSIADGAPLHFVENAETAMALISLLDQGRADLFGAGWHIAGRTDSAAAATKVRALIEADGLAARGWQLDLGMPEPAAETAKTATATSETGPTTDKTVMPDRTASEAMPDVAGTGAMPEAAQEEPAATQADPVEKEVGAPSVAADTDTARITTEPAVPAPPPFSFAALKQGDRWLVGGNAPIAAFQRLIDVHLGIRTKGELAVATAPQGFGLDALAALDALNGLASGRLLFDGKSWILSGIAADEDGAAKARSMLAEKDVSTDIAVAEPPPVPEAETGSDQMALADQDRPADAKALPRVEPAPVEPEPLPLLAVHPFLLRAELKPDGAVDFSGYVPTKAMQRYLGVRSHGGRNDTALAAGAPEGFAGDVLAGLNALSGLKAGQFGFDGENWYLSGTVGDVTARQGVLAGLGARADRWTVAIAAPEPPAAPEPEMSQSDQAATADRDRPEEAKAGPVTEPTPARPLPVEPPPLPIVHPFHWEAELEPGGGVDFSGYVPTELLQRYLEVRSHGGRNDTALAAGAPEGFAGDVLAGLDALSGLESGQIDFDGASWHLSGTAGDVAARQRLLAGLGARADRWTVAIAAPEPPPAPEERPEPPPPVDRGAPDYVFVAEKQADGQIVLGGDVPAEAMRAYLGVFAGKQVADTLTVRPGAPQDFVLDAAGGVRALMGLDSGKLVYRDFAWQFAGKSASASARAAATHELAALPGAADWSIDIVSPTPLEICTAEVAAFDERNAILFNAGSARIAQESLPAIDEIASTLKACPQAVIHIEGHTDSDGDAESNLVLSVSRAEAVVDRLIAHGVGEERLYAIGYGESLPIASNDTREGKRHNRRIVITVSDDPG